MIENESLITCHHEPHKRLQSFHIYASYSTYTEVPKVKNTKPKQKRKGMWMNLGKLFTIKKIRQH